MKLSEAIRLGAMMKPQIHGQLMDGLGTCAMGAAIQASGGHIRQIRPDETPTNGRGSASGNGMVWDLPDAWITLLDACCPECPECQHQESRVLRLITHLNDYHRWTRERIADFVATLEVDPIPDEPVLMRREQKA